MYLLDADAFITPSRLHYSFDIAPGFWDWLASAPVRQHVGSVVAVRDEITVGYGNLVTWAGGLPPTFWIAHDADSLQSAREVAQWAMEPQRPYSQAARSEFLSKADYHLVAQARAHGHTVVTHEQSAPLSQKSVKIPDACHAAGVPCLSPYALYRQLGLRLIV